MYLNTRIPTFCRVFVLTTTGEEAAMIPLHFYFRRFLISQNEAQHRTAQRIPAVPQAQENHRNSK